MASKNDLLWQKCLDTLRKTLNTPTFMWFETTSLVEINNGMAVISTTNPFTKEWLEKRYLDLIKQSLREEVPDVEGVEIIITEGEKKGAKEKKVEYLDVNSLVEERESNALNERYTFETFVIGSSNRFAYAAARSVSETPTCYNPLFIYGGAGLGKTHLLHAIGYYSKSLYPKFNVVYLSTEKFVNEYIDALINNRIPSFQKKYRSCDILLMDDIQFLANKERMQEEFFHTFNDLHNNNKQIVITCDRPPKEIPTLEERLISRFEWGLVTDIQPPDLETRIAILRKKAELDKKNVPDDVIHLIASKFESNIRELEGALIRVIAYSSLTGMDINIQVAKDVLKSMLPESSKKEITIENIIETTAQYFNIDPSLLKSPNRSRSLVTARHISMYLCRELTDHSLPAISNSFGGRHHSTVIHAIEKVKKLIKERREIYNIVQELTNKIKSG
jgi:chromosomal replication initiator protein